MRFKVRRARDMGYGYASGWFVSDELGHFRLFATWAEAQAYAHALSRVVNAEAVCA